MVPKRQSVLKNSAFFAALFAVAILSSYLFINWPNLTIQWQYASHSLPDSPPLTGQNSIEIPAIKLRAPLILADEAQKDNLAPLLLQGVVHHPETALPDQASNGVYIGHSSNYWWQTSDYNTVFALLEKLKTGDEININYENKVYHYIITEHQPVGKNSQEIFQSQKDNSTEITLVTCWPNGTDLKRFFVRARLDI
jgi:LPXTG-site transpeptidase (sortase) family protein